MKGVADCLGTASRSEKMKNSDPGLAVPVKGESEVRLYLAVLRSGTQSDTIALGAALRKVQGVTVRRWGTSTVEFTATPAAKALAARLVKKFAVVGEGVVFTALLSECLPIFGQPS